jgi:hypothetical protein
MENELYRLTAHELLKKLDKQETTLFFKKKNQRYRF